MFIERLLILTNIQCWYCQINIPIFFWLDHVVWPYSILITFTLCRDQGPTEKVTFKKEKQQGSHHPEPRSVLENVRRGGQELPLSPELSKTNCNLTDSYLIQAPPLLSTYWLKFHNSWPDWLMKTASFSCLLKAFKTMKLCYLKNNKELWKDTVKRKCITMYI